MMKRHGDWTVTETIPLIVHDEGFLPISNKNRKLILKPVLNSSEFLFFLIMPKLTCENGIVCILQNGFSHHHLLNCLHIVFTVVDD